MRYHTYLFIYYIIHHRYRMISIYIFYIICIYIYITIYIYYYIYIIIYTYTLGILKIQHDFPHAKNYFGFET